VSAPLRLICVDLEAPPLFGKAVQGQREGYEPAVGELIAGQLGRELTWVIRPWAEMIPAVQAGEGDAILCGQGIIPSRLEQVDFTRPYAIFDESVLVRAGSGISTAAELAGRRVAAIDDSANMRLAQTFDGAVTVPFGGSTDDVFGDMIAALRNGEVDAVVDDDVALVPVAGDPDFQVAFTVHTRNPWGIAVAKHRPGTLRALDRGLAAVIASGALAQAWRTWMPTLSYPLDADD
jgi:polar amino acid transport system substrate-binding protein